MGESHNEYSVNFLRPSKTILGALCDTGIVVSATRFRLQYLAIYNKKNLPRSNKTVKLGTKFNQIQKPFNKWSKDLILAKVAIFCQIWSHWLLSISAASRNVLFKQARHRIARKQFTSDVEKIFGHYKR